jgi:hypothetical protein
MTDKGEFELTILGEGEGDYPLKGKSADAFVRFAKGEQYAVTLFTLEGIDEIMRNHAASGEHAGGAYFWCFDLLILRRLDETHFRKAVESLLAEGDFERVLHRIRPSD